ncbi:hypothetical protein ACHAWF_012238 [Thalassiosira exigua]
MSATGPRSPSMIRLAPSPRDVPTVNTVHSPRSFRSSASHSITPRGSSASGSSPGSPKRGSPPKQQRQQSQQQHAKGSPPSSRPPSKSARVGPKAAAAAGGAGAGGKPPTPSGGGKRVAAQQQHLHQLAGASGGPRYPPQQLARKRSGTSSSSRQSSSHAQPQQQQQPQSSQAGSQTQDDSARSTPQAQPGGAGGRGRSLAPRTPQKSSPPKSDHPNSADPPSSLVQQQQQQQQQQQEQHQRQQQQQQQEQQQQQDQRQDQRQREDYPQTKSKKMIVVDPRSGRKYRLHADDHSLTDKELHIFHKKKKDKSSPTSNDGSGKSGGGRGGRHHRSASEGSTTSHHTRETHSLGETLETASALTEVSYYGRHRLGGGPFRCVVPGKMAFGDFVGCRNGNGAEASLEGLEERDDAECVEKSRFRELLGKAPGDDDPDVPGNSDKGRGLRIHTSPEKSTNGDNGGGRYDDEGNNLNPEEEGACAGGGPTAALSPLSTAFGSIVSPRLAGMARTFFPSALSPTAAEPGERAVEIRFRRACLVIFPDQVREALRPGDGKRGGDGLLGMTFRQDPGDFQAHVARVRGGSRAEKMGVRRGDVVSFAVALSNMTEENNSFLAEKLIKRLESVGMRTSYRELHDIFLSKTTNERPVGMVFRRRRGGSRAASPRNVAVGSDGAVVGIADEFEWSTNFLQSLSIKCREVEFERKVPLSKGGGIKDAASPRLAEESALSSFLPPPTVDPRSGGFGVAEYLNGLLNNLTTKYNCGAAGPNVPVAAMRCIEESTQCGGAELAAEGRASVRDFLSNRVLCSLVEQSMGLIFVRGAGQAPSGTGRSKSMPQGQGGFAVVRRAEGSWSAPCFLSILGSRSGRPGGDGHDDTASPSTSSSYEDVTMIVVRKWELVNSLTLGSAVKFITRRDERANVLVRDHAIVVARGGMFRLAADFFLAVKVNDVQNQGAYSLSTDYIEASDILTGTISPPEQSVDFYGALQSLELPYSMHSHPVIPEMLQPYSESDWVEFLHDHNGSNGVGACSERCGMAAKLQAISSGSSAVDKREVDIFARKFKYYLMDGVPVHRVLPPTSGSAGAASSRAAEEKVLRLAIRDPQSLSNSSLELARRRRPGASNAGVPSNFSTALENITKLSRTPPPSAMGNLDAEERKRFFSIETDLSPGPVMMLAKSKKDALILLCGLKLLLERERMISP